MPRKRRSYPAELKAKVALDASRGSDDGGTGGDTDGCRRVVEVDPETWTAA